jgi:hypothetical protein
MNPLEQALSKKGGKAGDKKMSAKGESSKEYKGQRLVKGSGAKKPEKAYRMDYKIFGR